MLQTGYNPLLNNAVVLWCNPIQKYNFWFYSTSNLFLTEQKKNETKSQDVRKYMSKSKHDLQTSTEN
jgi:hypothetical protein